jgi:hypothetical protein
MNPRDLIIKSQDFCILDAAAFVTGVVVVAPGYDAIDFADVVAVDDTSIASTIAAIVSTIAFEATAVANDGDNGNINNTICMPLPTRRSSSI